MPNENETPRTHREPRHYYSKTENGFYLEGVHANIPEDAVEISKGDHEQIFRDTYNLDDLKAGIRKNITADDKGRPKVTIAPDIAREQYDADINGELEARFDRLAREWGYKDAATLASYGLSGMATYKKEATAFITWRDHSNEAIFGKLSAIPETGARPSAEVILNNLPEIVRP